MVYSFFFFFCFQSLCFCSLSFLPNIYDRPTVEHCTDEGWILTMMMIIKKKKKKNKHQIWCISGMGITLLWRGRVSRDFQQGVEAESPRWCRRISPRLIRMGRLHGTEVHSPCQTWHQQSVHQKQPIPSRDLMGPHQKPCSFRLETETAISGTQKTSSGWLGHRVEEIWSEVCRCRKYSDHPCMEKHLVSWKDLISCPILGNKEWVIERMSARK